MLRSTLIATIVTAGLAFGSPVAFGQTPTPTPPPGSAPTATPTPSPTASPDPGDPPHPGPTPPPFGAPSPAPTPVFEGPGGLAQQLVDARAMAAAVRRGMFLNAFGYQFAIAQGGKLVPGNDTDDKRAMGFARSDADTPADKGPLFMKNTMRYEVASFTKNPVALATMKLLRMRGLSIESRVGPWLPPLWKRGTGYKKLRFRHLLTHTSGINQMLAAKLIELGKPTLDSLAGNDWPGLRWIVAQDIVLDSSRSYKNANYGLLAIANAKMWKVSGGTTRNGNTPPLSRFNYSDYARAFNRQHIFTPSGIKKADCVGDASKAGLNYPAGAIQTTNGGLGAWPEENCAGNAGLRLSAVEMVRYLAHLRHGKIVHPDDIEKMDELRIGWREENHLSGEPADARWHDGAFNGTNQVWTCGITFPDGTEAAMIVNSPLVTGSACTVLLAAWQAAAA